MNKIKPQNIGQKSWARHVYTTYFVQTIVLYCNPNIIFNFIRYTAVSDPESNVNPQVEDFGQGILQERLGKVIVSCRKISEIAGTWKQYSGRILSKFFLVDSLPNSCAFRQEPARTSSPGFIQQNVRCTLYFSEQRVKYRVHQNQQILCTFFFCLVHLLLQTLFFLTKY